MDKSDIISLVKSWYPFLLKLKDKTVITGLQVFGNDLRVYFDEGITEWDYCEPDIQQEIIKYLINK